MDESAADADAQELAWIRRVQADGDHLAFAGLLRRHQGAVRAVLRRLTRGDAAGADELAQECFLRAYQAMKDFRGEARLRTWLIRIACNLFLQQRRSADGRDQALTLALDDAHDVAAPGAALSQQVALSLDLRRALARLNEAERLAIVHCYYADLSHAEAAAALGWPLGTLKTHLLRGKAKLRASLIAWQPELKREQAA